MQAMTADDVPVAIKGESVDVRMTEVGEMTVSFIRLGAGTDLGPALVGLPGDRAPARTGATCSRARCACGPPTATTYRQGEAFYWAPGHVPVAEDCAYVDFSPTEQFPR